MSDRKKTPQPSEESGGRVYSNTPTLLEVLEDIIWAKLHHTPGAPYFYRRGSKLRKMRLLLVLLGGGPGGVFQAGMCQLWQEMRLSDLIDAMVMISAGAPNGIALASGDAHKVVPFYERIPWQEFINIFRRGDPRMRLHGDVIEPIMEMIDHDKLRASRKRLYAIVTEWETGKGRLVPLHVRGGNPPWPLVMQASMAIPGLSPPVALSGIDPKDPEHAVLCGDGAWAVPMPLGQAFKECRPTHVIIMGCLPDQGMLSMWDSVQTWSYIQVCRWLGVPSKLRDKTYEIDKGIHEALIRMCREHPRGEPTTKYLALFPKASTMTLPQITIWPFIIIKSIMIAETGKRGYTFMKELLDKARGAVTELAKVEDF